MKHSFSEEEKETNFMKLKSALEKYGPLPSETGGMKEVPFYDFMLMHEDGGNIGFKHIDSRNYVFVLDNGELYVPTGKPFMQGRF